MTNPCTEFLGGIIKDVEAGAEFLRDRVDVLVEHGAVTVMRPGMVHAVEDEIDPWPSADPVEEVRLAVSRIASGDWTREQACVVFGVDPAEIDRENEADRQRMVALRLEHDI